VAHIYIVAEKGFKVITVKEKYYRKVKEYYRNIVEQDLDPTKFISEARNFQEEIKENKVRKLDPLQVKKIWNKEPKVSKNKSQDHNR
jgi:hypothetical protein